MNQTIQPTQSETKLVTLLCLLFVLIISYFTYFHNYWYPAAPYWDENYYITDAQREMNHMYYMQIHPPLGKQLIALGEILFNGNEDDAAFINTEHQGEFPQDFSFVGYRFFPVLLAWLTAPLLFLGFLLMTRSGIFSALLSFLYIFDNALIVHGRGAMLDAPLLFFMVAAIVCFLSLFYTKNRRARLYSTATLLGIMIGCALTTKMSGLILILLLPTLALRFRKERKYLLRIFTLVTCAFCITFIGVWHLHFNNMREINPTLKNDGYYSASESYKKILDEKNGAPILSFPMMLRDSFRYMDEYNQGIPKLDLCKPDENGSPVFLWPFGVTSINYRWATDGSGAYRYLYLVGNPVVWLAVICGVICSIVILCGSAFYPPVHTKEFTERKLLLALFLALYGGYLTAFLFMDRVHFLYSYLPALVFGFFLVALSISSLERIGTFALDTDRKIMGTMILSLLIFSGFQFYRPLTYYQPLTDEQMERRSLLRLWNLRCVNCEKPSPLVRRQCDLQ